MAKIIVEGDEKTLKAIMKRSRAMNVKISLCENCETKDSPKESKKVEAIKVKDAEEVKTAPKTEAKSKKKKSFLGL